MNGSDLLSIPLYLALFFWFFGLIGTWRRVIVYLVFGYAALIIASQHNGVVSDMGVVQSIAGRVTQTQQSALAFAIVVIVVFVLLYVLFRAMWGPTASSTASSPSGLSRLSQSLITGITGWAVGVMLAISLVTVQVGQLTFPAAGAEMTLYRTAFNETTRITIGLIRPWLPNELPLFLRDWTPPEG